MLGFDDYHNFSYFCALFLNMKKIISLVLWVCLGLSFLRAQSPAKYWIAFADKEHSGYSVSRPEEFMSERALALRQKHHIPIDELDLPVSREYVRQVLALDTSARLFTSSKWLNGVTVYAESDSFADHVGKLPFVTFVERTVRLDSAETQGTMFSYPLDGEVRHTLLSDIQQRGDFDYGYANDQIRLNNAHWLHRLGFHGEGIRMMVLDGGFEDVDQMKMFEPLRADHRLLGARNMVQPELDPMRKHTHGTMVLSCIAAYQPGVLVGAAPMVEVYLCQTEDARGENPVEEDNWVAGVELADMLGCQILNSSLGYTVFDDSTQRRTYEDLNGRVSRASRAATIAASKGMLICNSAGNEGMKDWKHISSPADAKDILSVGAVSPSGLYASFSSKGPTADGRVKPDACAVGNGVYVGSPQDKVRASAGTSFSSPLLSGMVSCLWQAFPEKSNYEVMRAVRASGHSASDPDPYYGYGVTDFLCAFNYLYQSAPKTCHIRFYSFVAKDNKITFYITPINLNPKQPMDAVQVSVSPIEGKGKSVAMTYKVDGPTTMVVKLPKSSKHKTYQFYKLGIELPHESLQYIIGQE